MAQLETRIKKLEAQMTPSTFEGLVILREFIPALNGKVCPEYAARGPQTATCDDLTFSRKSDESAETFRDRVSDAVRKPGAVVHALLE